MVRELVPLDKGGGLNGFSRQYKFSHKFVGGLIPLYYPLTKFCRYMLDMDINIHEMIPPTKFYRCKLDVDINIHEILPPYKIL